MREIIFMVLLISFNFFVFGQNNFGLKIGAGANYTSAVLDRDYYETPEDIELYEIQGGTGYNLRIGVNYLILPKFLINCNINYLNSNYKYNIYDELPPDTPLQLIDEGETKLNIHNNSIGVTFGPEIKVFKNISLKYFISYYKRYVQKTKLEIKYWSVLTSYYEERTEIYEKLESELTNSIEFSIDYKRFSFSPGFEYTFNKTYFNPSNNTGNKYRFYFLIDYIFK